MSFIQTWSLSNVSHEQDPPFVLSYPTCLLVKERGAWSVVGRSPICCWAKISKSGQWRKFIFCYTHRAGRHFRTKLMSWYIGREPKWPVWCEDSGTCFKSSKSWGIFEKKRFLGSIFVFFFLLRGRFWTNLHEILAPGLKLNLLATLFYKKKSFWLTVPTLTTPLF